MSGFPPHELELKIASPVILIRNLDPSKGLCNGTRLKILDIKTRVLQCQIMNGSSNFVGSIVLIPRISISPSDTILPFKLCRRQFPLKLCFAMTINKAQGQSLHRLGVFLPDPCFGHGQLYVALSRAGFPDKTKVLITHIDGIQGHFPNKIGIYTPNVVFPELII